MCVWLLSGRTVGRLEQKRVQGVGRDLCLGCCCCCCFRCSSLPPTKSRPLANFVFPAGLARRSVHVTRPGRSRHGNLNVRRSLGGGEVITISQHDSYYNTAVTRVHRPIRASSKFARTISCVELSILSDYLHELRGQEGLETKRAHVPATAGTGTGLQPSPQGRVPGQSDCGD